MSWMEDMRVVNAKSNYEQACLMNEKYESLNKDGKFAVDVARTQKRKDVAFAKYMEALTNKR